MTTIRALYRYPIKGLSPEPLDEVVLVAGRGFPGDREFALTNGGWTYSEDDYAPRPKVAFLMLMQHETLAALKTRVEAGRLLIDLPDGETFEASLHDEGGRERISRFFANYLGARVKGLPQIAASTRFRFTDVSVVSPALMQSVSLINLASVRDFADRLGTALDPLRFRANIYFDGGAPWEEFDWMDREICIGAIRARVVLRTRRCAATNVDPATGVRDLGIPQALLTTYGHGDLGVYAELLDDGELRPGHAVTPPL